MTNAQIIDRVIKSLTQARTKIVSQDEASQDDAYDLLDSAAFQIEILLNEMIDRDKKVS